MDGTHAEAEGTGIVTIPPGFLQASQGDAE